MMSTKDHQQPDVGFADDPRPGPRPITRRTIDTLLDALGDQSPGAHGGHAAGVHRPRL